MKRFNAFRPNRHGVDGSMLPLCENSSVARKTCLLYLCRNVRRNSRSRQHLYVLASVSWRRRRKRILAHQRLKSARKREHTGLDLQTSRDIRIKSLDLQIDMSISQRRYPADAISKVSTINSSSVVHLRDHSPNPNTCTRSSHL